MKRPVRRNAARKATPSQQVWSEFVAAGYSQKLVDAALPEAVRKVGAENYQALRAEMDRILSASLKQGLRDRGVVDDNPHRKKNPTKRARRVTKAKPRRAPAMKIAGRRVNFGKGGLFDFFCLPTPDCARCARFIRGYFRLPASRAQSSAYAAHRSNIARVYGDRVILDGTTIEEVESTHRETLKQV